MEGHLSWSRAENKVTVCGFISSIFRATHMNKYVYS